MAKDRRHGWRDHLFVAHGRRGYRFRTMFRTGLRMTFRTKRLGRVVRRSRLRRASESAYGLLLLARLMLVAGIVLLIVAAGMWASFGPARQALSADGRGTMKVEACSHARCTGSYAPASPASQPRARVVLKEAVGLHKGDFVAVMPQGGSDDVVRTGTSGVLWACLPLGGALLLAAVLIAGGLRMRRTAWAAGLAGLAVLLATASVVV